MGEFDPYLAWLDIATSQRPVNHYRLLGLPVGETSVEKIEAAFDRVRIQVQQHASGEQSAAAQRLLGEIDTARACLVDPARKQQYDVALQGGQQVFERQIKPPPPVPGTRPGSDRPAVEAAIGGETRVGPAPPPSGVAPAAGGEPRSTIQAPPPVPGRGPLVGTGITDHATAAPPGPTLPGPPALPTRGQTPDSRSAAGIPQPPAGTAAPVVGASPPPPSPPMAGPVPQTLPPPVGPPQVVMPPTPQPPAPPVAAETSAVTPVAQQVAVPTAPGGAAAPSWAPDQRSGKVGKAVAAAAVGKAAGKPSRTHTARTFRRKVRRESALLFYSIVIGATTIFVGIIVLLMLVLIA